MVVLVAFDRSGALADSHAEWKAVGGSWLTVWDWQTRAVPEPVTAQRRPNAAPAPRVAFHALTFRQEQGRSVASVALVLAAFHRSTAHAGRTLAAFKRRHPDLSDEVYKAPRTAAKRGGQPEWVATERALKRLHAELT